MKHLILVFVVTFAAAACAPQATTPTEPAILPPDTVVTSPLGTEPNPLETPAIPSYAPKPGDVNFDRNPVFIGESGIILRESFPVQVALELNGELPTPCHQLRVITSPPDQDNKIVVVAYTVVNPQLNCIQVIKPFQELIELGSFPSGHYTVWVNEILVGEFDS